MARNLKVGDRVSMNAGFLPCAYCPCPLCPKGWTPSASATVDPVAHTDTYTRHHDGCPGIGKPVPPSVKVERVIKTGTVTRRAAGGRMVWVQWDDEPKPVPADDFNLDRIESIVDRLAKLAERT
jgi:hypothetical protein